MRLGDALGARAGRGVTRAQLKAAYNYQFVLEDGSFGIHNTQYAVGLLKSSIADLKAQGAIAPLAQQNGVSFVPPRAPDVQPDVRIAALTGD